MIELSGVANPDVVRFSLAEGGYAVDRVVTLVDAQCAPRRLLSGEASSIASSVVGTEVWFSLSLSHSRERERERDALEKSSERERVYSESGLCRGGRSHTSCGALRALDRESRAGLPSQWNTWDEIGARADLSGDGRFRGVSRREDSRRNTPRRRRTSLSSGEVVCLPSESLRPVRARVVPRLVFSANCLGGAGSAAADPCTAQRRVVELLIDQIECADVLILNKADIATEGELATTSSVVAALNPRANPPRLSRGKREKKHREEEEDKGEKTLRFHRPRST